MESIIIVNGVKKKKFKSAINGNQYFGDLNSRIYCI